MYQKIISLQRRVIVLLFISLFLICLILLGGQMNSLAISENNNKMPVLSQVKYSTQTHFSYSDPSEINYSLLSDRFSIGKWIYSLGDLLMFGFFFIFVCVSFLITLNFYFLAKYESIKFKKREKLIK